MVKDEFITLEHKDDRSPCILRKSKIKGIKSIDGKNSKIFYGDREVEVLGKVSKIRAMVYANVMED